MTEPRDASTDDRAGNAAAAQKPALEQWAGLISSAGPLTRTSRMLDVGGGSGALAAAVAAVSGARCTVLDSQADLTRADGIRYVEGVAEAMPLADAAFDAVLMSHVLHHLSDPVAALREAARVTSQGGRLIIRMATHADLRALPHACWIPRLLAGILDDLPDLPTLTEWLQEAGWRMESATSVQTCAEMGIEEYADSVALHAFRNWALCADATPDPRGDAHAWAVSTFSTPPPTPETLLTAIKLTA